MEKENMITFETLPHDILKEFLCYLSAKETAFLSILGPTFCDVVDIRSLYYLDTQDNLGDFLQSFEDLPASSRVKTLLISLDNTDVNGFYGDLITHCLSEVHSRGVDQIFLDVRADKLSPPSELLTFSDLSLLSLGKGFVLYKISKDAFLPNLKTFVLHSVSFYKISNQGCPFKKLLSVCPALESLDIYDIEWENWKWDEIISSSSLKRLELSHNFERELVGNGYRKMTFDLPCLQFLHYRDVVPSKYEVVNFQSLVTADLDLVLQSEYGQITSDPTELLKGLRNVV